MVPKPPTRTLPVGKLIDICQHNLCFKGSHPSFKDGWFCMDCEQVIELDLSEYNVVFAALHTKPVGK